MVVPGDKAVALDAAQVQGKLVDAQMDGAGVGDALTGEFERQGYAVYRRESGDFFSELVRTGANTAAKA